MNTNLINIPSSNILNVRRFLTHLAANRKVSSCRSTDLLTVIPGVGSFDCAIEYLNANSLDLHSLMGQSSLVIGICLGMHISYASSQESAKCLPGYSLSNHIVVSLQESPIERAQHTGWNYVFFLHDEMSTLSGYYYFSHAYGVQWYDSPRNIAYYYFNGRKYVAATRTLNFIGLQFHPELSGPSGISLAVDLMFSKLS